MGPRHAAVFLDRDGVIVEHRDHYLQRIEDAVFVPGALDALARLASSSYLVVIVTNQALVGRGIIPHENAEAINQWVTDQIQHSGGRIDRAFLCPHHPDDNCDCRKPKPGMLLQAAAALDIDLERSVMIGDAVTDLQAGVAAGARPILVRTGRGLTQLELLEHNGLHDVAVVADLAEAVEQLLAHPL